MKINFKEKFQLIKFFFIDSYGWARSLFLFIFRSIKRPCVFYGYANLYWATKYANKRTKNWKTKWDQSGKQQAVFPIGELNLLTCSKMELRLYKKKKLINKKLNPRKAMKKSYYTTAL